MGSFFCKEPSIFEREASAITEFKGELTIPSVDHGIILPLRKTDLSKRNTYEGGVCDEHFQFVAGYFRKKNNLKVNKTCVRAYRPEKEIDYLDEEVIFAGIYFNHFGHAITDGFSRLWCLSKDILKGKKIVFVNEPGNKNDWTGILCCLGISKDDIIVINENSRPIKFRKVYIPEQSFYFFESFHQDMTIPYDTIINHVSSENPPSKKVYLSRTLLKDPDCVNEEYFENLYKSLGFEILHTQNMTFIEQVRAISSAKEIVSTVGTLTHMALFSRNGARLTGLLRSNSTLPTFQYIIDKAKGLKYSYVDVSCNFLPSHGEARAFYIGPNENWRRFFLAKYDKLLSADIYDYIDQTGHNFGKYLKRWINTSLKKGSFKFIAKANVYDIIESFERAERSELAIKTSARDEISDLYGLKKKLLNKKFNLFTSRDGSPFEFDRAFELARNNQLNTMAGKTHSNEAYWQVLDGGLKIVSTKEKITHEYFEPKTTNGKIQFSGFFKSNPFILFRLEEIPANND